MRKGDYRLLAVFGIKACLWFGALWIVVIYTAGFAEICMEGVLACIPVVLFSAILTIGLNLRAKWVRRFGSFAAFAFAVLYYIGMEVLFWGGTGHDAAGLVMNLPLVGAYACAACLLQMRSVRSWLSE